MDPRANSTNPSQTTEPRGRTDPGGHSCWYKRKAEGLGTPGGSHSFGKHPSFPPSYGRGSTPRVLPSLTSRPRSRRTPHHEEDPCAHSVPAEEKGEEEEEEEPIPLSQLSPEAAINIDSLLTHQGEISKVKIPPQAVKLSIISLSLGMKPCGPACCKTL